MHEQRFLSALLAAAMILMFFGTGSATAAGAAGGSSDMEPQVILKASCFHTAVTLNVLLHNAGSEASGRIFIDYDGTKLIFTSCTAGPVGLIAVNSAEKYDRIFISFEGGFPTGIDVLLATMVFSVRADAGTATVFAPTVSELEVGGTDQSGCVTAEPLKVVLLTSPAASDKTVTAGIGPQSSAWHSSGDEGSGQCESLRVIQVQPAFRL